MKLHHLKKITFGMTSAIISGIAAFGTLIANPEAKTLVITSLLVFAFADNIADTFGMHMYQDSEMIKDRQVWMGTFFNYATRLAASLLFIAILLVFPSNIASVLGITIGFILLTVMSYLIAIRRKSSPLGMIAEHIGLALFVLILSTTLGSFIRSQIQ